MLKDEKLYYYKDEKNYAAKLKQYESLLAA